MSNIDIIIQTLMKVKERRKKTLVKMDPICFEHSQE